MLLILEKLTELSIYIFWVLFLWHIMVWSFYWVMEDIMSEDNTLSKVVSQITGVDLNLRAITITLFILFSVDTIVMILLVGLKIMIK